MNIETAIKGKPIEGTLFICAYDYFETDLLSCQADNGSSSEYSWKIDENKEDQTENRVHVFQTWKKQLSESD